MFSPRFKILTQTLSPRDPCKYRNVNVSWVLQEHQIYLVTLWNTCTLKSHTKGVNIFLIYWFFIFSGKGQFQKNRKPAWIVCTIKWMLPSKVMSYLFWLAAPLMDSSIVPTNIKQKGWSSAHERYFLFWQFGMEKNW